MARRGVRLQGPRSGPREDVTYAGEVTATSSDRRELLKKAAVGGAVAWAAPTILSGVASAQAPVSGGCVLGQPTFDPPECGPPKWSAIARLPFTGCVGAVLQSDLTFNGVPQGAICVPLSSNPIVFGAAAGVPFVIVNTVSIRSAGDGTILAGPIDVTLDTTSCPAPPGAPIEGADPSAGTIQLTVGDRTFEIPVAG